MKKIFLLLLIGSHFWTPIAAFGQDQNSGTTKNIEVETSLKIISHVIAQLEQEINWNKHSKFEEECNLDASQQTLRCAIRKAQIELTGTFENRNYLMRMVRQKIQQHFFFRQGVHPINSFNKHPKTSHKEVLFILNSAKEHMERACSKN